MPNEDYIYAVARAHMHERSLLSKQDIEQLASAGDTEEAFRLLYDKGWGSPELPAGSADALIAYELAKTWTLVEELSKDSAPFHVFRVYNDYHNLKAAIKMFYSAERQGGEDRYFLKHGTVPLESILGAVEGNDFSKLPANLADVGKAAFEALVRTGNGQLCDIVIDKHALIAIYESGCQAESNLLRRYAELKVDCANIKTAVRCAFMKKDRQFIDEAIAPAGTLETSALAAAAAQGPEAVYTLVASSSYAEAADALRTSLSKFEAWCDNQMIRLIRPERHNYFGIEPLAAFLLGRENEIKLVRLILSAKINNLSSEMVQERLRETYV